MDDFIGNYMDCGVATLVYACYEIRISFECFGEFFEAEVAAAADYVVLRMYKCEESEGEEKTLQMHLWRRADITLLGELGGSVEDTCHSGGSPLFKYALIFRYVRVLHRDSASASRHVSSRTPEELPYHLAEFIFLSVILAAHIGDCILSF
jgi:hypothetical protein